jgi:hypothetical protein
LNRIGSAVPEIIEVKFKFDLEYLGKGSKVKVTSIVRYPEIYKLAKFGDDPAKNGRVGDDFLEFENVYINFL